MEARTGDSPAQVPVEKTVPLSVVQFTTQVHVPGFKSMYSLIEVGAYRTDEGRDKQFPQIFYNPVLRTVVVGSRHYPIERVVYFERAKAALTKLPPPPDTSNYTIGPRKHEPSTPTTKG
jgi:hypothetical protein